jgi:hypothetical protein
MEVECDLLMAIGDGMGEVGMSLYFDYCRRRRRRRTCRRHAVRPVRIRVESQGESKLN